MTDRQTKRFLKRLEKILVRDMRTSWPSWGDRLCVTAISYTPGLGFNVSLEYGSHLKTKYQVEVPR